ncbi:MAG: CDC48 family AAA ATPase [Candidatus Woesearchaeota archaeon]|nr:CDC48 family AAA ATPase [Candidatus Woesearchaeota archaeon]MDP7181658.1 CDC48 family AAA ATPase [Candidatus Woesearchaeota archaeon]MDP7198747.1 CDC48 family AAA ATPase [Candidatus Woesearchaeota archaeon]MDP7467253.1 CDC48 family AAA ATPase [Candidatus Woesearchaeota archaeon]MDP7647412.1 CDC48 family AAA ATPase [Candidatus Woesearchaeota archaeon]
MAKDAKLKVAEAIQDDVNKGIVRIDSNFMRTIDVRPGDIVEIEGERKTVAIVDRAYPGDIGLNIVRMDGLIRKNGKTSIGESVKVQKGKVDQAKRIVIAPAKEGIVVRASANIFKQGLLGRALMKGDIISLGGTGRRRSTMSDNPIFDEIFPLLMDEPMPGFGFGDLKFIVAETNPSKTGVIVTDQTEIVLNPEAIEVKEEAIPEVTYEDIGGLHGEITKVREMIELPLKHPEIFERLGIEPPKGVLLHGPPGTGKTLLAKAVANETNSHFLVINGPEIMSKYYGMSEENLRKKFEEAEKNAPAIIFIDEIDAIATKREETKGEVERRVVAQMLALMDGLKSRGKVIVIAATNVPNTLDPALRRPGRFDREIEIGIPNKKGRNNILKIHTRSMPLAKEVKLEDLASITHGFVGADLASLTKEAAMILLRRVLPDFKYDEEEQIPKEILEKLIITKTDFEDALKVVRPSALREVMVESPSVEWDAVGGLEEVKQEIKEAVEWPLKHPGAFKRLGVSPPKGILLYGAPGTGKTLLAQAVATESEANFISVKGPELLSKWVGESEKAVREIFKKARQTAPTIIFFDELDSLAPKRSASEDNKVGERVVNQLLTEMDGLEGLQDIVIIGATNRPDMVDTALLRPGRFDRIILTPVPDKKTRKAVFDVHLKGMPLDDEVSSDALSQKTEGFVGADIEAICREAAIMAMRTDIKAKTISMKHFEDAMKKVRPSVTKEIEKSYQDIQEGFRSAHAKQMGEDKPNYFG